MNATRRYSVLWATVYLLLSTMLLGGCAAAWITPIAPSRGGAVPLAAGGPTPQATASPTLQREPVLHPTPTLQLAPLLLSDAPLQYWSDPNDITGLVHDGADLWAATSGGVVRWHDDGTPRLYTLQDGLASQAIRGIAQDGDGHIWVGYVDHGGWAEYNGITWRSYATREEAVEARYIAMLQAPRYDPRLWTSRQDSDWLWLPTAEGQIEAYDGEKWRVYGQHAGITSKSWLVSLSEGGRVWTVGRGVSTAQEGERWWKDHNFFSGIADARDVSDIAVDAKGGLWISFVGSREQGGGVCRFDPDANLWQSYLHELNPTIPLQVHRVQADPDGTMWLCGDNSLIVRRWGRPWRRLSLGHVEVQCFLQQDGRYWLGTARGIWSINEKGSDRSGPWLIPSPLLDNAVTSLARDGQGRLWIGTEHGTSYIDASGETGILTVEETLCLATSKTGLVWVGTSDGLYTASREGTAVRMFDGGVIALAFDAANVPWICTQDGQLMRLSSAGGSEIANLRDLSGALPRDMAIDSEGTLWFSTKLGLGSLSAEGDFRLFTVEDDLLSDDVRAVALASDDVLWIATAKGLVRRRPTGRWTRFTTHSTEGGLRSMAMQGIYVDAGGKLWMATAAGVSCRTPEEADWSYCDVPNAQCVLPDPSGALWAGTSSGLYRVTQDLFTPVP